jgi:zinc transporter 2
VIIASVIIWCDKDLKYADPICTLIFAVVVLFTTIPISGECISVVMEAAPRGVNWRAFTD